MQSELRKISRIIAGSLKFGENGLKAPKLVSAPDESCLEVTPHDVGQKIGKTRRLMTEFHVGIPKLCLPFLKKAEEMRNILTIIFGFMCMHFAYAGNVLFAPPKDIANGSVSGVSSMDAGDLDGDGLGDIVVIEGGKHAGGRKTFAWFSAPSSINGKWDRHNISHNAPLKSFLGSAKLADMDRDGDLDLIVSSDNHSGASSLMKADVFVFVNPGPSKVTGSWSYHKVNTSELPVFHINDMEITDMDRDGKQDIICRSLTPNQIFIFFQNSISSYTKKTINTNIVNSEGLAVGLLDGDRLPDITFTGFWLKSPGNPRTQNYTRLNIDSAFKNKNQNTKEAIGDIDGDGRNDVVIGPAEAFRGGGNHHLAWYKNPGNTSSNNWQKFIIKSVTNNNHTVKLGDIDNDNDLDVVIGIPWKNSVASVSTLIYYNDGTGDFGNPQVVVSGKALYSGVLYDLDADGDLDIVGQNTYASASKPYVYESLLDSTQPNPTPTPPKAPSTLSATALSDSSVELKWKDNASNETGFQVYHRVGSGSWSRIITTGSNTTSFTHTGLSAATVYGYRVRARNSAGVSSYSKEASVKTPGASSPSRPQAPSNLIATVLSSSSIQLKWKDNASNETGFQVYHRVGSGSWSRIITTGSNTTSFTHTGLSAATVYGYRVRARNSAGVSSYSKEASVKTPDTSSPSRPQAPSNLTATVLSSSSIQLKWKDNASNETGFQIYRRVDSGSWSRIITTGSNITSFAHTGLSAGTVYGYRVRSRNSAGVSSYSNEVSAQTPGQSSPTSPHAPSGLTATVLSPASIELKWEIDPSNKTGFKIYRKIGSGSWKYLKWVGAYVTTFKNTGLSAGTLYTYRMLADNAADKSSFSNEVSAQTPGESSPTPNEPSPTSPHAPSGLTATVLSPASIELKWEIDPSNKTGFKIYRKIGSERWKYLKWVGAYVTTFKNTGLNSGTLYTYRMLADNAADKSSFSNEVSAQTQSTSAASRLDVPSSLTSTAISSTLYEDAEDFETTGWIQYKSGSVNNVRGGAAGSDRAIEIIGDVENDVFRLGNKDGLDWNNESEFTMEFFVAMDQPASGAVYVQLETNLGLKYLVYVDGDVVESSEADLILVSLGKTADGHWHKIFRNLEDDLKAAIPEAQLKAVKALFVYGSLKLDNVTLLNL